MKASKTLRGFARMDFKDCYGAACSLQKSSLASADAVWLGVDDASPQIMAIDAARHGVSTDAKCGWVPFPVPDAVLMTTRMHLTRKQVSKLLPILQRFVETGELAK